MRLVRRDALILIGAGLAGAAWAETPATGARATDFAFVGPSGEPMPLQAYAGRPILVVNTATACGYAGQLAGLQALWTRFHDRGLAVVGVPSADFGGQEPLDGPAIAEAARRDHGVTFPLAGKTRVRGASAHPFYRWAATERPGETPRWNFHKYLVARDGTLAAAFAAQVEPADPRLVSGIAAQLDRA